MLSRALSPLLSAEFAPLGSMEKLAFIQNLVKNGMDTNKLVTDMLNHESFQVRMKRGIDVGTARTSLKDYGRRQ